MELKSTLLAAALVVFASTATVFAADDAATGKTEAAKPASGEVATPAKKKVNRHSHPVDKGVMPPSSADKIPPSSDTKENTEPKKRTHDHKKEMKGG